MSAFFSFLLGHGYNWSGKLLLFAILLALWQIFVEPYAAGVQVLGLWFLNQSFYKIFSYQVALLVSNVIILASTFKIIMWIVSPDSTPSPTVVPHA